MNRVLGITFTLLFSLVGCTSNDPATLSTDDKYVNQIVSQYPELAQMPREDLIDFGMTVCDGLDAGMKFDHIVTVMMNEGATPKLAGVVSGSAIGYYCPEHLDDI